MGEGDRGMSGERASPLTPTEAVRDAQQASVQLSHQTAPHRGRRGSKMLSPGALPSLPPLVESRPWDGNSWTLRAEQASLVPGKPQTEKQRGAGAGGQKRSLG